MASFFDELKSGLESLLDKVAGDDAGPVPNRSTADIRAKLEARAKGRPEPDKVHPIAQRASSSAEARRARARIAERREARVHKRAAQRDAADQQARDAAYEELKRQAASGGGFTSSYSSSGSSSGSSSSSGSQRRRPFSSKKQTEIAKHYKTLDLPHGADFPEVKKAFRAMMRKYHPDMHSASPEKQKAAAELTKQLTVAYNALELHLKEQ